VNPDPPGPRPKVRQVLGVCLDGLPFVAAAWVVTGLAHAFGGPWVASAFGLLAFFVTWFFRDPERTATGGPRAVLSPADGRIIDVRRVPYPRLLSGEATRISIFMSVFNVHVNRIPCSGVVRAVHYNPGKFRVASVEKASLENEQAAVVVDTDTGPPVMFVQIAGLIARRIVCHLSPGERVERGGRFGLIRFGSRCDVYLPEGAEPRVRPGETAHAGETVLGELK
jgi:phosphatidylserine decarboxylase